jgi:hypothetical protein
MANKFNAVPNLVFKAKPLRENRNGFSEPQIISSKGTATSSAGAVTLNAMAGIITTEPLTTAAAAVYTLTLTNANITTSTIVQVSVDKGSSTGTPCVAYVTPSAGSAVIAIQNIHASAAFNAAIKISYVLVL